jgi:hypothetical protein
MLQRSDSEPVVRTYFIGQSKTIRFFGCDDSKRTSDLRTIRSSEQDTYRTRSGAAPVASIDLQRFEQLQGIKAT